MVKQEITGLKDLFWRKRMISKIKTIFKSEQFNPKILGLFINPFYFARKGLYESISKLSPNLRGKLLDIGCGTKPYKDICKVDEYIGLEIDDGANRNSKHADVLYDGRKIPFSDKTFDSIIITQVFEHVFNPEEFFTRGKSCNEAGRYVANDCSFCMG
jgi:2-polyprenyl-3-methyl-5-hydroxy-6-metoxy-1,4-benzoquinol methylase